MQNSEKYLESLLTLTSQESRELAIKLTRKSISAFQTDPEARKNFLPNYAHDTAQFITSAHVIAVEFQTITVAINYRKP